MSLNLSPRKAVLDWVSMGWLRGPMSPFKAKFPQVNSLPSTKNAPEVKQVWELLGYYSFSNMHCDFQDGAILHCVSNLLGHGFLCKESPGTKVLSLSLSLEMLIWRPDRDSPNMVSPWKCFQVYGDSHYSNMDCSVLKAEKIIQAPCLEGFISRWLALWKGLTRSPEGTLLLLKREVTPKQIIIQKQ